ncbi:hypothetical protein HanIR_Chr16g0845061 [Helianthus annuus]|nr:hypothetical protein HanIR_Chr16g0845061 [Helianthus annuus]
MSSSRRPGTNLLGLSLPAPFHTYHWLCNPLVISFSLIATYQGLLYIQTYFKGLYTKTYT